MKPSYFTLPVERFDLNLLPSEARNMGSNAFKTAVIAYFAEQYASKNQQAVVAVDDHDISVLVLPSESNPLDFVMTMLQAGRIKEAVPYLETLCWRRLNLDSVCRSNFDRGRVASIC